MFRKTKTLKAIVLSMVLAAGVLLPASATAQGDSEEISGLFGKDGYFGLKGTRGMFDFSGQEDDLTNADFGEDAPLGSGIAILIGAGLGYVTLKKKEDKQ